MKNTIKLVIILFAFSLSFTSCKKDEESTPAYETSKFTGKWEVSVKKSSAINQEISSDAIGGTGNLVNNTNKLASNIVSFEFTETRYLIENSDGSYSYGVLTANSDQTQLDLEGKGTLVIVSIDGIHMSVEFLGEVLSTVKADYTVPTDKESVKMFTYDVWIVKEAENMEVGSEFLMTKNGTYVFYQSGYTYVKYWRYIDEETWGYGWDSSASDGEATNVALSYTEWRLHDTAGKDYYMTRPSN